MSSKQDSERYGPLPKGAAGLAMFTGAVAGVQQAPALAQDASAEGDTEIIVTGSPISRIEGETAMPAAGPDGGIHRGIRGGDAR